MKKYPSQAKLRELFDYDPEGYLVWRVGKNEGQIAGSNGVKNSNLSVSNYLSIGGRKGFSFRLTKCIFIWHHGYTPKEVYHANGNCFDNRISNIKEGRAKEINSIGRAKRQDSGFYYVYSRDASFAAIVKKSYLGSYASAEDAAVAVDDYLEESLGFRLNETHKKKVTKNITGFKNKKRTLPTGVTARPSGNFRASISGKCIGTFKTQEEAARAYNIAAYERYGEHAVLNDIPDPLGKGDLF